MQRIDSNITRLPNAQTNDEDGLTDMQLNNAIDLAKRGDLEAFRYIYNQHLNLVYGLCFRLCADKSQAEDASQEVFIQLWQKIDSFNHQSKFTTWLHSVASNVCISYIRKQKGWWQKVFSLTDEKKHEQQDWGEISADTLEALVLRLPERTRLVFVLHGIEGYRHEQVAQLLSISTNTSKVQFHRARAMIEEWVNE